MLTKQEKIKQVEEISQGFSQGKILVFLDIAGLKVNELNNLRKMMMQTDTSTLFMLPPI